MTEHTPSSNRLDGWPDIAAHLGVSQPTARALEDRLGLPVRRMRTPGGEIVFAFVSELGAWRREREQRLSGLSSTGGLSAPDPRTTRLSPAPTATTHGRARVRSWLAEAAALGFLVVAFAAWRWLTPVPIAGAAWSGSSVTARDATGRTLWSHGVGHTVGGTVSRPWPLDRDVSKSPVVADLDGDGPREVLVVATSADAPSTAPRQELVCLSNDGRVRWRYRPDVTVTLGGRSFGPPWIASDLIVSGRDTHPTIWTAWVHPSSWPAIVLRVDPAGNASVALVNAGAITTLAELPTNHGTRVLAGGLNREWRAAMVAVLDDGAPPVASPSGADGAYACASCEEMAASRYVLFPRTEFARHDPSEPVSNTVTMIQAAGNTRIVRVRESETFRIGLDYVLNAPTLSLVNVDFGGEAGDAHRRMERAGSLDHDEMTCPERSTVTVRYADGAGGWRNVAVPRR